MNRTQALARIRTVLGKTADYRFDATAPDAEERAAARVLCRGALEQRDSFRTAREKRRDYLLSNDAEYQRLKAAEVESNEHLEKLRGTALRYRITVGTSGSIFFHVKAQGDTWPEVFEKLGMISK